MIRPLSHRPASALVITLSCLVILSIIVVAFLSQATLNRQLALSSAGQTRAQVLAEAAKNTIIDDLRAEMQAGSTDLSSGTNTLWFPITNAAAVPFRNVPATLTNLVRVSRAAEPLWTNSAYLTNGPTRSSQKVAASTPSINGRYIKPERWNKPFLLGAALPPAFSQPDWFLLTRSGPISGAEPALQALSDRSSTNTSTVIGRYAYAIYDEGGLLDINVAGNKLDATNNARRGRLHGADLGVIPDLAKPADLITWRNAVTSTNNAWLDSASNSFLTVHPGDQRFISRQDLIQYARQHPDVLTTNSLPYLGTFTREKNAPSFRPATVTAANPVIPAIVRADGKPLMSRRFALSWLDLVRYDATANSSSDIYRKFGLMRSSAADPWVYNHGNPAKISTLAEVALQNRDPDFFEVLKAAILEGSLGKTAGNPSVASSDTAYRTAHLDANLDLQIIRIGANLIDQYDADSWPTAIQFQASSGAEVSYGIENLPYINRMFDTAFRPSSTPTKLGCWYEFEMWNPHQNPPGALTPGQGPQAFRITATGGQAYASLRYTVVATGTSIDLKGSITTFTPGSSWIQFNLQSFGEPTLLASGNAACDSPPPAPDETKIAGISVGTVDVTGVAENATITWNGGGALVQTDASGNFPTFELQYLGAGGQWTTFQKIANLRTEVRSGGSSNANSLYFKNINPNRGYYFRGDPRNVRFGGGKNGGNAPGLTMRGVDGSTYPFKQDEGKFTSDGPIATNPGWTLLRTTPNPTHARLAALANNDGAASTSYKDFDGVLRVADGGLRDLASNPLQSGDTAPRPVVLNRAFRSVGEMGYAFRDQPWKTLDLFTANSADAGLLDAFSLDESDVVAGKVDLNTRQSKTLEALLSGAARQANAPAQTISASDVPALAAQLAAFTAASPLLNKANLVTGFSPATVSSAWPAIKTQREAFSRALGEAGNIRTWNLLIDFIVQVGKIPTSAKSTADFVVEGEKRYWLHLAIDRYTGEIVDQQMEAVSE